MLRKNLGLWNRAPSSSLAAQSTRSLGPSVSQLWRRARLVAFGGEVSVLDERDAVGGVQLSRYPYGVAADWERAPLYR